MHEDLKERVAKVSHHVYRIGLTWGPGGNVSAYDPETGHVVITATGITLAETTPESLVVVDLDGKVVEGTFKKSSETPMHTRIYKHLGAQYRGQVHTHSPAAAAVSCMGKPLPAIHYLMAAVGHEVPVTTYATYGSEEVGERVVEAIGENKAVLLANHGVQALGVDVEDACKVAETVEYTADLYLRALSLGTPRAMDPKELDKVAEIFKSYGQPRDEAR